MLSFNISESSIKEPQSLALPNSKTRRITVIVLYSMSALIAVGSLIVGTILSATYTPTHEFFDFSRGTESKTAYLFYYASLVLGITALVTSKLKSIKLYESIPVLFFIISMVCLSPLFGSGSAGANGVSNWLKSEHGLTSTTDLKSFKEPLLMQNSEGDTVKVTFERQASFLSLTKIEEVN